MHVHPVTFLSSLILFAVPLPAQQVARELAPAPVTQQGPHGPSAVSASYVLFGDNCGTPCASLNDNRGTLRTGTLTNEYTYGHKFAAATVVLGFQLYTRTNTAPLASMSCSVFRESTVAPGTPDTLPFDTGTMTCTNTLDFYSVFMTQPVIVNAGETIWISQLDSLNILAAGLATGTSPAVPTYWRRPGLAWAVTGTILYPAWRIICANNLAFNASGVPKLGGSMTLSVLGAPANSAALLFLGSNNPGVPVFCTTLYASPTFILSTVTNATGDASIPLSVPNDTALDGAKFWNQWWIVSPSLAIVGTNGGAGIAGT